MRPSRLALVAAVALALLPLPAQASFAGRNGPFVLSLEGCHERGYLVKVPRRGGPLTPLTDVCEAGSRDAEAVAGYSKPAASPDGRTILAIRREEHCCPEFVTLNADGTGVTPVPLPQEEVTVEPSEPSFAPDGQTFAFDGNHFVEGREQASLWAASLDGTNRRRIEQPCEYEPCPIYSSPIWSPDGRKIVLSTDYWHHSGGGANGGNIYIVSRDGERRRELVHRENLAEFQPAWSPDGRWIAWVSLDSTRGGQRDPDFDVIPSLWRIRVRGGEPQKIQTLPHPFVEDDGAYVPPYLTWMPR